MSDMNDEEGTDEITTEFDYKLQVAFDYASDGDQVPAQTVKLKAPTVKHRRLVAKLKQAFLRSLPEDDDDEDDDKVATPTAAAGNTPIRPSGKMIMFTMGVSKDVDLGKVLDTAVELFLKVGRINGKEALKPVHFDRMSMTDLEGMLGEYLSRFILASSVAVSPKGSS